MCELILVAGTQTQGSDARDLYLARPFAFSAVIRSGRAQDNPGVAKRLAGMLLASMHSKSFLREASAACLLELLETMTDEGFHTALKEVEGLEAVFLTPAESATPEVLESS